MSAEELFCDFQYINLVLRSTVIVRELMGPNKIVLHPLLLSDGGGCCTYRNLGI